MLRLPGRWRRGPWPSAPIPGMALRFSTSPVRSLQPGRLRRGGLCHVCPRWCVPVERASGAPCAGGRGPSGQRTDSSAESRALSPTFGELRGNKVLPPNMPFATSILIDFKRLIKSCGPARRIGMGNPLRGRGISRRRSTAECGDGRTAEPLRPPRCVPLFLVAQREFADHGLALSCLPAACPLPLGDPGLRAPLLSDGA